MGDEYEWVEMQNHAELAEYMTHWPNKSYNKADTDNPDGKLEEKVSA